MSETNPDALARLEALHAAATPGKWSNVDGWLWTAQEAAHVSFSDTDSASIVALHNAFPAMAAVVRAAREYREGMKRAGLDFAGDPEEIALDAALAEFEKEVGRG